MVNWHREHWCLQCRRRWVLLLPVCPTQGVPTMVGRNHPYARTLLQGRVPTIYGITVNFEAASSTEVY